MLAKIGDWCYRQKVYFLSFIVPALVLCFAYAVVGIFPFGERSALSLDVANQYVHFYSYYNRLLHGEVGWYNWFGAFSGGFFGDFAYYCASPYLLLVGLFPIVGIQDAILLIALLKCSSVGFTTCWYFRKHKQYSEATSLMFSLCFALSGYFISRTLNPMWLDGLIVIPLITAGIENIVQHKKRITLYVVSLCYALVTNFYIGFMLCIFSVLYFLYCYINNFIENKGRNKVIFGKYVGSSIIAGMLSAVILLPAFLVLATGKATGEYAMNPSYSARLETADISALLMKLLPCTYDNENPYGLPMLYVGSLTLIFTILFFLQPKRTVRSKLTSGGMLLIFLLSLYIRPLDYLWHGGQSPIWMNHRYSFIIGFFMLLLAADAFEHRTEALRKKYTIAFGMIAVLILVADLYTPKRDVDLIYLILVPAIIIFSLLGAMLFIENNIPGRTKQKTIAICVFTTAELILNTCSYVYTIGQSDATGYFRHEYFVSTHLKQREELSEITQSDDSVYRIEKLKEFLQNEQMSLGYSGISYHSSLYNTPVALASDELGICVIDGGIHYLGSNRFTDTLFGIKYVMDVEDVKMEENAVHYSSEELFHSNEEEKFRVYKNPDVLPLGFAVSKQFKDTVFVADDPFDFYNQIASSMLDEQTIIAYYNQYVMIPVNGGGDLIERSELVQPQEYATEHVLKTTDVNPYIDCVVDVQNTGPMYMYLNCYAYRDTNIVILVRTEKDDYRKDNRLAVSSEYLVYLGDFEAGDTVHVKLTSEVAANTNDVLFEHGPRFGTLDVNAVSQFSSAIQEKPSTFEHVGLNDFKITVKDCEDSCVFTSIPFDRGWSATCDGVPIKIEEGLNHAFMCVDVPDGDHEIVFTYEIYGLKAGFGITLVGILIFAFVLVFPYMLKKQTVSVTEASDTDAGQANSPEDSDSFVGEEESSDG